MNRAADDAAGLSISEVLASQMRGSRVAARNILDAISMLKVADGAVNEIAAILQRMRELAVQSANGTYAAGDRTSIQAEFAALGAEITNIAGNTAFNGLYLLLGVGGNFLNSGLRTANAPAGSFPSQTFGGINQTTFTGAAMGIDTYTLGGPPEVYNLGTGVNESIKVQVFDSVLGTWRTVPYDTGGGNGYTYNAGTNQITLTGTEQIQADETQIRIDYIGQGSLTQTLSGTPIAGSETIRLTTGSPATTATLAAGTDYTLSGNTLTITGAARPGAGTPTSLQASFIPTGTTTIPLSMALPSNPFAGGILDTAGLQIVVNGVVQPFTSPADFTIQSYQVDAAGQTPLYAYNVVLQNTSIDAASATSTPTVQVRYDFDYPTTFAPLVLDMQVGANEGETMAVSLDRVSLGSLGLNPATVDVTTLAKAADAIAALDGAIASLSALRSRYGADINRMAHTLDNVTNLAISMDSAYSRIRDADMAQAMSLLTRQQILNKSAGAMLSTANFQPRSLLALLSG